MKEIRKHNWKKLLFVPMAFMFMTAKTQVKSVGTFLGGGIDDANELAAAYLTPFANAFGASINGGWYNTAKVHKLGGFDLTFCLNTAMVPQSSRTYDLTALDLNASVVGTNAENAPTLAGEKIDDLPSLRYTQNIGGQDVTLADFNVPNGANAFLVPAPMIKAGIGFIKETEITGRYMPDLKVGKTTVGMWGVGAKHSIKQYIPVLDKVPLFHWSVQMAYTRLRTTNDLSVTPEMLGIQRDLTTAEIDWTDQQMQFFINAFTANMLVSLDVPVFTLYGGVGMAYSNANLVLAGYYPVASTDPSDYMSDQRAAVTDESVLKDPIDVKMKNTEGGLTKPRLNAGFRLKFAVVTIHFDYTYANYSVFSTGLGISVR